MLDGTATDLLTRCMTHPVMSLRLMPIGKLSSLRLSLEYYLN